MILLPLSESLLICYHREVTLCIKRNVYGYNEMEYSNVIHQAKKPFPIINYDNVQLYMSNDLLNNDGVISKIYIHVSNE